ncbi:hypothetical protein ABXY50_005340 [Escherichia coli]
MATMLNTRIRDLALFKDAGLPDLNASFHHEDNRHSLNIWGNGGAVLRVNWCAVPAMIERRQYHVSYEVFHAGRLFVKDSATSFLTIAQLHGLVILLVRDVFC